MNIKELARIGARARIQELHAEIEAIRKSFPGEFDLRGGAKKPRRKRRKLSAAGRKAISDAAKKRWAKIRAAKKG